jgi:hypothetical protein
VCNQLSKQMPSNWLFTLICLVTGLDLKKINKCVGDPNADENNEILKAEQDAQV